MRLLPAPSRAGPDNAGKHEHRSPVPSSSTFIRLAASAAVLAAVAVPVSIQPAFADEPKSSAPVTVQLTQADYAQLHTRHLMQTALTSPDAPVVKPAPPAPPAPAPAPKPAVKPAPKPVQKPVVRPKPQAAPPAPAPVSAGDPRAIARQLAAQRGWGDDQFNCLNALWNRESGWNVHAANRSGAYGIPQALPGSKMGAGWQNDATVQITWGLNYIAGRYGNPCGAWSHSQSTGWY